MGRSEKLARMHFEKGQSAVGVEKEKYRIYCGALP
jgi:hypothetical protein